MIKVKRILTLIILSISLSSCLLPNEKGKVSLSLSSEDKASRDASKTTNAQVSEVKLINDKIIVTGTDLNQILKAKIAHSGSDSTLSILSQSANELILSSSSKIALALNTLMSLTLEDAYGATVVEVTFNLPDSSVSTIMIGDEQVTNAKIADGAITAVKLDQMSAAVGQLLRWNGSSWVATDLDALTYAGTWDASVGGDPNPAAVGGEYYIVSADGTADPGDGNSRTWTQGDWIVFNDNTSAWDQISNSSDVTSFEGRTGGVTAQSGDYTWAMINKTTSSIGDIADVDLSTPATTGKILKFNGTSWVADDDLSGGGASSVTSSEIADGSIVDADVSGSAAIAWSKISKTGASASDVGLGNVTNDAQLKVTDLDDTTTLGTSTTTVPSQNAVKTYVDNAVTGMGSVTSITGGAALSDGPITTAGTFDVLVDDATIEVASDALQVKALGIGTSHLAANAVTNAKITSVADTKITTACSDGEVLSASSGNFVCANTTSVGNWTKTADPYLYYNGGNVGIGTASPADELEVNGTMRGTRLAIGASATVGGNTVMNVDDGRTQFRGTTSTSVITGISDVGGNAIHPIFRFVKKRSSTSTPQLGFGGQNEYALEGFTPDSQSVAATLNWGWELTQSNDTTDRDAYLSFEVTQDDTLSEAMRIDSNGNIGIGTTSPAAMLDVKGDFIAHTLRPQGLADSAAAPGIGVYNDPDTGFFRPASNTIGITSGGTETMRILSDGKVGIGTNNPSTALEVNGTITASGFNGPLTSTTASVGAGTVTNPSYSFSSDTDTGFYSGTGNTIEISVGGTNIFDMSSSGFVSSTSGGASLGSAAGSAGTPTFSFAGDTDTGWYSPSANTLAASSGGTESVRISSTGNLGIGTVSPSVPLHVRRDGGHRLEIDSVNDLTMFLERDSTDGDPPIGNVGAILGFSNFRVSSHVGSAIGFKHTSADPDTGGLAFFTHPDLSGSSILEEMMTLGHDGRLGIGDDTPGAKLDIRGSTQERLSGTVTVASGASAVVGTSTLFTTELNVGDSVRIADEVFKVTAIADDTNLTIDSNHSAGASGDLIWGDYNYLDIRKADGDSVLRVNKRGWVGIGTNSPASELEVVGTITADQFNGPVASTSVATNGGSAGSPGYSFSGDTDTGLFSSTSDTLEVSVGGSNIFDLSSAGLVSNTSGGGVVTSANGTAASPTFSFSGDTDTGWFHPAANTLAATTGGTERVRIDSSGNVGIGTINPTDRLHVHGADGSLVRMRLTNTDTGETSSDGLSIMLDNSENTAIWNRENTDMIFANNSTEVMRIDNIGNVGIGTSSPTGKFQISSDRAESYTGTYNVLTGAPELLIRNNTAFGATPDSSAIIGFTAGNSGVAEGYIGLTRSGNNEGNLVFGTAFSTTRTEKMRIDKDGNVGIGTTTPTAKLQIDSTSIGLILRDSDSATSTAASPYIQFENSTGSRIGYMGDGSSGADAMFLSADTGYVRINTSTAEPIQLYTNASERMRIDDSGNVGIGTTNPTSTLHVVKSASGSAGTIEKTDGNSSANLFTLMRTNSAGVGIDGSINQLQFAAETKTEGVKEGLGTLRFTGEDLTAGAIDSSISLLNYNNGSSQVPFHIESSGDVGIGTISPNSKLEVETDGSSSSESALILSNPSNAAYSSVSFDNYTSGAWRSSLWTMRNNTGLGGIVGISTADSSGAAQERMRITDTGNVGIGTSGPVSRVDIVSKTDTNSTVIIRRTDDSTQRNELQFAPAAALSASNVSWLLGQASTTDDFHIKSWNGTTSTPTLTIENDGDVGIGTTSPVTKLHVDGTARFGSPSNSGQSDAQGASSEAGLGYVETPWVYTQGIEAASERAGASTGIALGRSALPDLTTTTTDQISLYTTGTSRIFIASGGNVGVGLTNPSTKLDVNGIVQGTGAYSSASDERYKKNYMPIASDDKSAVEKILELNGLYFDWRHDEFEDKKFQEGRDMGVIAQDVEKVFPEAVRVNKDGFMSVAYAKLVAPLIEAVKELFYEDQKQNREIASLKEKNEKLEKENDQMKSFLCQKYSDADFCSPQ